MLNAYMVQRPVIGLLSDYSLRFLWRWELSKDNTRSDQDLFYSQASPKDEMWKKEENDLMR